MNWEKLAFMLEQEAKKVINETMESPAKTVASVSAALSANMVLSGLAKCINLARIHDTN